MKGVINNMKFQDWLKEQLETDPEFKVEFEKIQSEKILVKKLAEARIEQNLTQQDLAEKAGVKQSHLSRFESGKHTPSWDFVHRVAYGLGKTIHIEVR